MNGSHRADLLDGLPLGVTEHTSGRTIGEGEFAALTSLTWTTGEAHTNREPSEPHIGAKERVLGATVTLAVASGLVSQCLWERFTETYRVRTIRSVAIEALHEGPVHPGDTLYVEVVLQSATASNEHPGLGLLIFADRILNQRNQTVATVKRTLLFERTNA
jgi:acyl dehydratase